MDKKKLEEATKLLESEGYVIKPDPKRFKKHTFDVDKVVLRNFFEVQETRGLRIRDAVNEALSEWTYKNQKQKSR